MKPGRLTPARLVEIVVHVDLDQVRGGDLGPQELMPLHQELAVLARHAHGAMVVDDVVPAVMGDEPVDGGEVDARLPFRRRHGCADRFARWHGCSRQVLS